MKKHTVILAIHEWNDKIKEYYFKALTSIKGDDVKLLIVTPLNPRDLPPLVGLEMEVIENKTGANDFCSQVNLGIQNTKTEWFSILEVDDRYSEKWFTNVNRYITAYPDTEVFLPIVADIDEQEKFLSFTNEALWALGFSTVQGFLDNQALIEFQNIQISGAVYKTEVIKKFGYLKPNIKLSFGYEFLLRLTHNNVKIMTIPKIGYKHTNMRTDSLFWKYKNDEQYRLTTKEGKFWMDTARKEYYFTEQRDISYTE